MKKISLLCWLACLPLAASTGLVRNVLIIAVDDLRPELGAFGVDYIHSPRIDRLAGNGRAFFRHYVNAPTCGASRHTLLTGRYGDPSNRALFLRAQERALEPSTHPPSMPEWFRQHGYTTVAVGKVSHHPGGRGGPDWNDASALEMPAAWDRALMPVGPWQHPRGAMHGLAHGEIRNIPSEMNVFQSEPGPDAIYPDGGIVAEGLKQLETLAQEEAPFFLAIGLIKPHLPFGAPRKYRELYDDTTLPPIPFPEKPDPPSTWHPSNEFMQYHHWGRDPRTDAAFATEVRRHYAACVSYVDQHVGDILDRLEAIGAAEDTVVVLWGDHGWHLGEHGIWGKHSLFEESLRSPLVIAYPGIEKPGEPTNAVVESVDIFPTLCQLAGLAVPEFATGQSLCPQLEDPNRSRRATALAYRRDLRSLRTDTHRLILHANGAVELYDHTLPEKESRNLANENPELVQSLLAQLAAKRNAPYEP